MTDSLQTAVTDLKSRIGIHILALRENQDWREIQRLYAGLGVLEDLCGLARTDLSSLLGIGDAATAIGKLEFAGQPPLDAAKQYLQKIAPKQKAASLDDILDALQRGGLKANRDDLRISLSRSIEIYKAGEDIYGLVESFPHIKRRNPGRRKAATGNGDNSAEITTEAETDSEKDSDTAQ